MKNKYDTQWNFIGYLRERARLSSPEMQHELGISYPEAKELLELSEHMKWITYTGRGFDYVVHTERVPSKRLSDKELAQAYACVDHSHSSLIKLFLTDPGFSRKRLSELLLEDYKVTAFLELCSVLELAREIQGRFYLAWDIESILMLVALAQDKFKRMWDDEDEIANAEWQVLRYRRMMKYGHP